MMKRKRGISPIIATIFLVVITLAGIALIYSVVIPLVKNTLAKSECFEAIDQLKINTRSSYTCYNESEGTVYVNIKRGPKLLPVDMFRISVSGDGESKIFNLKNGTASMEARMFDGGIIEIPNPGEERTYSLNTTFKEISYVETYYILKGGTPCDKPTDTAKIEKCS